ncbi:phosphotransferase [Kitasatospora sp. NPDC096147]|uniref:phosphotransferase n=1 Tax=Kitasatospora sp. NPDC096147 TaxID=3364093 RepID=UPI0038221051
MITTSSATQSLDALTPAALHALEVACARRGHDTAGAVVLQNGFNQVLRLPHAAGGRGVIAKLHRPGTRREAAERQAAVASWVLEHRVPTARPLGRPTAVRGLMVSFTEDLGPGRQADPDELAVLLHLLHDLPLPDGMPAYAPTARLLRRLAAVPASVMTPAARSEVRLRLEEVERRWWTAEPLTRRHLIHGDVGPANTLVDRRGVPHLIDWETAAAGPPALDLGACATRRDHYNANPRDYQRICAGYGTDITDDDCTYQVLATRAACSGVIVAAELAASRPEWRPQYLLRLACLSALGDPGCPYPWTWQGGSQLVAPEPQHRPPADASAQVLAQLADQPAPLSA